MVARQDYDREVGIIQQPRRSVYLGQRQPVVVEDIASKQEDVCAFATAGVEHLAERVKRVRGAAVDMKVGAVDNREVGHAYAGTKSAGAVTATALNCENATSKYGSAAFVGV